MVEGKNLLLLALTRFLRYPYYLCGQDGCGRGGCGTYVYCGCTIHPWVGCIVYRAVVVQ